MHQDTLAYNENLSGDEQLICQELSAFIDKNLKGAENKVWHAHPVWFLDGNPVVGYAKRKCGINLLFWSGQTFDEPGLKNEGKFKAAEICYSSPTQIVKTDLKGWLKKSAEIQWDYKNIVKRKGVLERLV